MTDVTDFTWIYFWPVAGGGGVRCTTPSLPKGPLFVTKWAKNGVFCRRVKGSEVQKVHFLGQKGPLFRGTAPPQN